jgi:hypothetical protein
MSDDALDLMKRRNVPLTRENYLDIAYSGDPPEELDGEAGAELPLEFRTKNHPDDWEEFE